MLRRIARSCSPALVSAPGVLSAQYFGRNKVQYTDFDFKVIQTEHFDVYYYDRERAAAAGRRPDGGAHRTPGSRRC